MKNKLNAEDLITLINEEFNPVRRIDEKDLNRHLLGVEIDLEPRDLLLLLYLIEERHSIKIPERVINNTGLRTINEIIKAVNITLEEINSENSNSRQ